MKKDVKNKILKRMNLIAGRKVRNGLCCDLSKVDSDAKIKCDIDITEELLQFGRELNKLHFCDIKDNVVDDTISHSYEETIMFKGRLQVHEEVAKIYNEMMKRLY